MSKLAIKPRLLFKIVVAVFALLLTLVALLAFLALGTAAGARRMVDYGLGRIDPDLDLAISYQSLEGSLLAGLHFNGLQVDHPTIAAAVSSLDVQLQLGKLLSDRIEFGHLQLDSVEIELRSTSEEPASVPDIVFDPLPFGIYATRIEINELRVLTAGEQFSVSQLQMAASLVARQVSLDNLVLRNEVLQLRGTASIELQSALPLEASLDYNWNGTLPLEYERAVGQVYVSGDLQSLQLRNNLREPLLISSEGSVEQLFAETGPQFDLNHNTEMLQLPVAAISHLQATNVSARSAGTLASLELSLAGDIIGELVPGIPRLSVVVDGLLQGESIAVSNLNLGHETGAAIASGRVDWANELLVTADFQVTEENPQPLIPQELPMQLSDLRSSGSLRWQDAVADGVPELLLDIDTLQAQLGDYAMAGAGQLRNSGGLWAVENLQLQTEDNRVRFDGQIGDPLMLAWDVDIRRLEQFLADYEGSIQGAGTARGSIDAPLITGSLRAAAVRGQGLIVDQLDLQFDGESEGYSGEILVSGLSLPELQPDLVVSNITAQWQGSRIDHQIEMALLSNRANLEAHASGGFTDSSFSSWRGTATTVNIESELGNWQAEDSMAIRLSPGSYGVEPSCWLQQDIRLCIELNSLDENRFRLDASLSAFPLTEFNGGEQVHLLNLATIPRLPAGVTLDGTADVLATALFGSGQQSEIEFSAVASNALLNISPRISEDEAGLAEELRAGNTQRYLWPLLELEGSWRQGNWRVDVTSELAGEQQEQGAPFLSGSLATSFELSAQNELGGNLTASFQDLGWLQALVPQLTQVAGSLGSELQFSGTLEQPIIVGDFELNDASFFSNRFGVNFTDLQTRLTADSLGAASFQGSVNSGEGSLGFSGEITELFTPQRRVSGEVQGADFRFVDLPELQIALSPQINISASAQGIDLSGRVEVPQLELVLQSLPETAVDISRDVAIVRYPEDRPDLALSLSASQSQLFDIPVSGEIVLVLGNNISFEGFGLSARLEGELEIQQFANGNNFTYGEVAILDGNYQMYGQNLRISQGNILFLGALDNPALDVRAVREVGDQTVGVLMNGTLRNRRSQLFSSPVLPENDILAVLITGRPYSQLDEAGGLLLVNAVRSLGLERGQGITTQIRDHLGLDDLALRSTGDIDSTELTLGKYLTPELFVRYGVGLFDREAKVSMDYYFSERFKLQAESGEYQSVDFTYTVER